MYSCFILNFCRWKSAKFEAENHYYWRSTKCSEKHKTLGSPSCSTLPEVAMCIWLHLKYFNQMWFCPVWSWYSYLSILIIFTQKMKGWLMNDSIHSRYILWNCKLNQFNTCVIQQVATIVLHFNISNKIFVYISMIMVIQRTDKFTS